MDQDEPVLDLSDVVHDEPMGDEDPIPSEDERQSSPYPPGSITPLHESYNDTTPVSHHLSPTEPRSKHSTFTLCVRNGNIALANFPPYCTDKYA